MQFASTLLMVTLTLKLLVLPHRVISNSKVNRSRWFLTIGTSLLAIQFFLQYLLGLRANDVNAAVRLNIAFFIPCSAFFSLAIINLQRQGYLSRLEIFIGIPFWLVAIVLSQWSIIAANVLFTALLLYYVSHQIRNMKNIRNAVANFYDSDLEDLLSWMQWSIVLLAMMAIMVPLMIFIQGPLLAAFCFLILLGIAYLIDCFCLYAASNAPAKVVEAQENEQAVENEEVSDLQQKSEDRVSDNALHRVELAVAAWIDKRGHLQAGLNLPSAAEEIGVPRYLLSAWLKQKGLHYSDWLTALRIDEAKQVMRAHPDWSNETIALHCGFSDRTYFQRKFKDLTGLTPTDYLSTT